MASLEKMAKEGKRDSDKDDYLTHVSVYNKLYHLFFTKEFFKSATSFTKKFWKAYLDLSRLP